MYEVFMSGEYVINNASIIDIQQYMKNVCPTMPAEYLSGNIWRIHVQQLENTCPTMYEVFMSGEYVINNASIMHIQQYMKNICPAMDGKYMSDNECALTSHNL
ncbi:hypothetical protein CEXT_101131 [Caerostris extrusa]|uniref:Uncharacterized protein n=1 Tax=Caerostris extrusa TaxID=172846 RepID=A0AAV4X6S0_CAEEX|nr:hypothetical protein CEXT_101131 [Caerostris extrusa]